jgi:hypothetical protein
MRPPRNVGKKIPTKAVQHPKKTKAYTRQRRAPKISHAKGLGHNSLTTPSAHRQRTTPFWKPLLNFLTFGTGVLNLIFSTSCM